MVFSSTTFLFVFLPLTIILYFTPMYKNNCEKKMQTKNLILCLASLIFYAWGEPVYIFLMLISIYFNFNIGLDIDNNIDKPLKKKLILTFALIVNLSILGFFKYYGFAVENLNNIFGLSLTQRELPLPVGISFYTFQIISYIIDVYRSKVAVQKKLTNFACYVSLFPQLIAGPIVQYSQIEKQLKNRTHSISKFSAGLIFFLRGLGKKVLFANIIGNVYTQMTTTPISELSVVSAWFAIACFTLQIYFDFSGYSDMAIGLGKMFGFEFMLNFNLPYTAVSITDFWSRWHISLSSWFKNYVYIPLGGNRKGTARTIFNLLVVWCLTGLWHGASWNFAAWGLYYALLLIAEKFIFKSLCEKLPHFLKRSLTMIFVMFGWVLFSSTDLTQAMAYISAMLGLNANALLGDDTLYYLSTNFFPFVIISLSAIGFFSKLPKFKNVNLNLFLQFSGYIIIFLVSICYLISETYNPFLYFRF